MKIRACSLLFFAGLSLLLTGGSGSFDAKSGYRAVTGHGEGFVAAGSDGRIDRIDGRGRVVRSESFPGVELNCLLSLGPVIFAAGGEGVLLIARDGADFRPAESGTTLDIRSLAAFQDYLIAGADGGTVLIGDQAGFFGQIPLELRGDIVSLSANRSACYGVTDRGEIFHSRDLVEWAVFDFNAVYSGYYEPCRWSAVVATEQQLAVAGSGESGRPVLFFSAGGAVWTPRSLDYTDPRGMPAYLDRAPNAMLYDAAGDRFVLACDRGTVMVVPSCSHCNERHDLDTRQDLTAISQQADTLIVAGECFYISTHT